MRYKNPKVKFIFQLFKVIKKSLNLEIMKMEG
jgi:hypothetical protein